MDFWTFENLAAVTGGAWWTDTGDGGVQETANAMTGGIWHDTRHLRPGEGYVALKGERVDGHSLLAQAAAAGAGFAMVTDRRAVEQALAGAGEDSGDALAGLALLGVTDAVQALQALASAWRDVLSDAGCRVISVSGSNGKTTTRSLVYQVLSCGGLSGSEAPASFNNHLGVPLTLLRAKAEDAFVALELGTNHPGEMATLAQLARPDVSVITSIGEEHLEAFGDVAGVAREESAVMPWVARGGVVFAPVAAAADLAPHYDVQEGVVMQSVKPGAGVPDDFPLPGEHNRSNAALAAAVGRWLDVKADHIQEALRQAMPPANRSTIRHFGSVTLIDDCYNANPASMRAALQVLVESSVAPGGRRVALLGEMRELGEASRGAHREIAELAGRCADHVILMGQGFGEVQAGAVLDVAQQGGAVVASLRAGDVVLLKASRGMRLERLIPMIASRFDR